MESIFEMQQRLNILTMGKIGLDFDEEVGNPERRLLWIENYRKAFSAELAELIREVDEFGIGTQNGKVEIVDLLHFLVSLSQVVGVPPVELSIPERTEESFTSRAIATFLALDDLQNSMKWKWWAKGGGFKEEKAREAVHKLWECFGTLCGIFGMDFEAVKGIYVAKNRVNIDRQERGYNEDTKTEADNLTIPCPENGPGQ
ncbi:MAG: dUTP diphosphatase [Acidobacteriota bacterium]